MTAALPTDIAQLQDMVNATFTRSPVAISISHHATGLMVAVNHRWCTLMGFRREEVVGKDSVTLGIWEGSEARDAAMKQVRKDGFQTEDGLKPFVVVPYTRRDGRTLVLQMQGSIIRIDGIDHLVSYTSDITELDAAQKVLRDNERLLQRVNDELASQMELYVLTESLARVGHWTVSEGDSQPRWSAGLLDLTGLPRDSEMTFALARSRIYPDDLPIFVSARERMDGATLEYRWDHPEDGLHWMRSRMRRHIRPDGTFVDIGVIQDFTQEQLAKVALQEQLSMIQRMTSRLPEMVFQFLKHSPQRGEFVFVSDAINDLFKLTPQQVMRDPRSLFRQVHPDDLEELFDTMMASAFDGMTWAHEFRVRWPDGTIRSMFGKSISVLEANGQIVAYGSVTDITDHKASQISMRESEARFRALTQLSSDWYWEQDADFRFVRFDGELVRQAGRSGPDSMGKTRWEVGALNMTAHDWAVHRAVLESHAEFRELELQDVDDQGRPFWMSISGAPIFDADGTFKGYRGVGRNITARKRSDEKIERLAFYDVLTGLPNRRLLLDRLQWALATSARDRSAGALLFIDLDNFKDLNDTQGHDVGDSLLQQVANRLVASVREVDTVARLGGDEFVVMLQSLGGDIAVATAQAETVGKKLLTQLNQTYILGKLEHHSTPSIGVAMFRDQQQSVDELLKQADLAMYESKSAGRNTLRFFDPAMQALVAERTALEADLRQGLKRDELVVYYQPVVDIHSRVVGAEALVRWRHPVQGLVPPNKFIPMAEQTGLILPLGDWVLETACKQLAVWSQQSATAELTIAVNVSARQFKHPDFVQRVMALLTKTHASAHLLKLELTESLLLGDTQDAVGKMAELRSLGVKFSLDDFGTGYSSLSYLKMLPLEQLKIDQSFVRDVLSDPNDAAIARTVLALGSSLGLAVVAEGVESQGQREFLLDAGCKWFQGYLFGRPVPIEDFKFHDPESLF
jgi:diguanylate cyclase (GGDEF)-like protein/PAS domain S-box-containing protein